MATNSKLRLENIGQIHIRVRDLCPGTAFYRDTLGMHFLFEAPGMSFFDCAGIRLMLGTAEKPELDHPASILYYRVDDIQAAHETLVAHGVRFEQPPRAVHQAEHHDLWLAFCHDSEDNLLALMSEVPRS